MTNFKNLKLGQFCLNSCAVTNSKIIEIVTFLSQPDVHLVDPIKMLEVSAEHEDGEEVNAQFGIVHISTT